MFPCLRVGLRAAGQQAARSRPCWSNPGPLTTRPHRLGQARSVFNGPRYTRFGGGGAGGGQQNGRQQQKWSNFGPVYRVQYIWRNYQRPIVVAGVGGGAFYVYHLEEVPVTHRRRFNLLSPETEKRIAGGAEQYQQALKEFQGKILPENHPSTKLVAHVVERLLPTTRGLAGDEWRVHVVDEPGEQNAFVMPGGKVFVFTGILPICETEAGVAAVLGHEIAHNVAHHVAERMSRQSLTLVFAMLLSVLAGLGGDTSNAIVNLLLSLPNSRIQEAEADHIGLLMMAEACYDPREALAFWDRMRRSEKFAPPQFLSTHPSNYNRMDHIRRWLPEATAKYDDAGCGSVRRYAKAFQDTLTASKRPVGPAVPPPRRPDDDDDDDFF